MAINAYLNSYSYRMPEVGIGKRVDVILETDHLILGAPEREVGKGIEDRYEERNQDADRQQKRRGEHQIGTKRLLIVRISLPIPKDWFARGLTV